MSIITLENVSFIRWNIRILDEITARFEEGRTTFIIGNSGSGKSTFLKICAGILFPDRGRVTLRGIDSAGMSEQKNLEFRKSSSFIFQDAALWSNQTIANNLSIPLRFHFPEMHESEIQKKIGYWCDRLHFGDDLNVLPSQLSLGESKIVALIRGIITDPDLLFMDNPTTSVDKDVRDRILNVIRNLKKDGKSLFIVCHEADIVKELADDLVVLAGGRLLFHGLLRDALTLDDPEIKAVTNGLKDFAEVYNDDILDLIGESDNETGAT